ncbi:MAG: hypothetical protein ACP5M4_12835 [Acidobacteriaceae bacterium]
MSRVRGIVRLGLVLLLALGMAAGVAVRPAWTGVGRVLAAAKHGKKRLILKDGTYLDVVRYRVKDGQVRYESAEGVGWQEIPAGQVDWKATKAWAKAHPHGVTGGEGEFETMTPAEAARVTAELDREERARRATVADLMPVVRPGLRLPDEGGIFVLDEYEGRPELLHLRQADGDLNVNPFHSVEAVNVDRMHGFAELVRMQDVHAAVQLHVGKPVFYVSVPGGPLVAPANAFVVNTPEGSGREKDSGGGSAESRFVIVKVVRQGESRVIYAVQVRNAGQPDGSGRRVETQKTLMAGGHWLKVTPVDALEPGEYALVELLGGPEVNKDVWDFGVNPGAPENAGALLPVRGGR